MTKLHVYEYTYTWEGETAGQGLIALDTDDETEARRQLKAHLERYSEPGDLIREEELEIRKAKALTLDWKLVKIIVDQESES